jgi:hypothetical protein
MTAVAGESRLRSIASSLIANCTDTGHDALSLLHVLASGFPVRPQFPPRGSQRLLILGSGPSLGNSLRAVPADRLRGVDLLCVNDFYKEPSFGELRPAMLAIADPAYWDDRCLEEYGGPLVSALATIDWKLKLLLPARARGTRLHAALQERALDFALFPTASTRGHAWLESALFSAQLGMPRPQNVLVAAVALGMWAGYRELAVVGADHSWHQEIDIDDANTLFASARHNYSASVHPQPFLKPAGMWKYREGRPLARSDVFSMREILLAWAAMHDSYERLARLAQRRGIRVFNCSTLSFIDAFERRALADFIGAEP